MAAAGYIWGMVDFYQNVGYALTAYWSWRSTLKFVFLVSQLPSGPSDSPEVAYNAELFLVAQRQPWRTHLAGGGQDLFPAFQRTIGWRSTCHMTQRTPARVATEPYGNAFVVMKDHFCGQKNGLCNGGRRPQLRHG